MCNHLNSIIIQSGISPSNVLKVNTSSLILPIVKRHNSSSGRDRQTSASMNKHRINIKIDHSSSFNILVY